MIIAAQEILDMWRNYLGLLCDFLEEPIPFAFVGLYFGFAILGYVRQLLHINDTRY